MSNLVLILLIVIFFFIAFLMVSPPQFHPLIFVWLRILLLYFFRFVFNKVIRFYLRICEGLARVDFCFFKAFLYSFCKCVFSFLFIELSQFHVLGHVFDLLTLVGCRVRLRSFLLSFFFALTSFLNLLIINLLMGPGSRVS
jgi:hypothetical protein